MALPEVAAALSATSGAIQLLKGINQTSKQVEINGIVLELQGQLIDLSSKIITIQSEYDSLTKAKTDVERELIEERKAHEDRSKYQLVTIRGSFAYQYSGDGSPVHHLCATCFDEGKKSILHRYPSQSRRFYECKISDTHGFYGE